MDNEQEGVRQEGENYIAGDRKFVPAEDSPIFTARKFSIIHTLDTKTGATITATSVRAIGEVERPGLIIIGDKIPRTNFDLSIKLVKTLKYCE